MKYPVSLPEKQAGRIRMPSMSVLLMLGLVIFIVWAVSFEIDQTVRAQGQIIPSAHTQIIQAADGGVLSKILVHEGQSVNAGQVLAVLESERSRAAYQAALSKQTALTASLERAQAETDGRVPHFDSQFGEVQRGLYEQRRRGRDEEIAALKQELKLAQEEQSMNQALLHTGDTSRLEVMRSQRQVSELQGKINAVHNKYLQEARQDATKYAEELAVSVYKLDEQKNILGHTELTAPLTGVVKNLRINTVGGVLRAGDELMQISPTDGDMVIEVKINPVDIGQIKLGLPVAIKLDTFDYATYGTLQGTLSHISSDTLTEQGSKDQTNVYYRAHVRINPGNRNPKLAAVVLKPGMTATVDVQTNRRSLFKYIAKPLYKAFGGAMNER